MAKRLRSILPFLGFILAFTVHAQTPTGKKKSLQELQQSFVNLRFGMFIHFNIPTYANHDWPDPELSPEVFNPTKLDCNQWAAAAQAANMTYGCLTTKHHSGFSIWDTKTSDYSVMKSPFKKDVVRQFVDAFRAKDLKIMLYYSILDTHHRLRPNSITPQHVELVKKQITELLTNYGPIEALIIDGWDAPWSRISYEEIPFADIYKLVKTLQPNCLLMDLNGAKYPAEGLFYTDIKTYEMGAGQRVSHETNKMPALACLPINNSWFWKTDFPTEPVKDPTKLINETIVPLNNASCNFILNVAPNREGLIDANAVKVLTEIGKLWQNKGPVAKIAETGDPIISPNLAKNQPTNSSWSDDMDIMDFANDDNFKTSWVSSPTVKTPWYKIDFRKSQTFNTLVLTEKEPNINKYRLEYFHNGTWQLLANGDTSKKVKVHRFHPVTSDKVRITIENAPSPVSLAEVGVYNEPK